MNFSNVKLPSLASIGAALDAIEQQIQKDMMAPRHGECQHTTTTSVCESGGAVLFRCNLCGMGRGPDGAWDIPAKESQA